MRRVMFVCMYAGLPCDMAAKISLKVTPAARCTWYQANLSAADKWNAKHIERHSCDAVFVATWKRSCSSAHRAANMRRLRR